MAPASSILSIFSCCLQRKPTAPSSGPFDTGPNEHSHLIPATNDPSPSSPSAYVVDHQRMKERMSHIVRSKEGKMVNVTSHLPFNLHNKKLKSSSRSAMDVSTSASASSSSPSRSASASTSRSARKLKLNRPSLNFTPYTSYAGTGSGNVQGHVGAPLTGGAVVATPVSGHGAGGPSRSSSLASREMSLQDHEHEESERWGRRTPILNVRLVQGVPFVPAAAAAGKSARVVGKEADGTGVGSRRGRAKRKDVGVDLDLDDQARARVQAEEGERGEAQVTPRLRDPHPTSSPPSRSRSAHSSSSCSSSEPSLRSPSPSPFVPKTEADADAAAHPTLCVSPASTASVGGFKLRDAGPLVVSWGD